MNRRRLVALAVTGFLGCTGDFEVADTPDQGLRDQAEDRADADETGADEGMPDERVADQRIVDMAPSETGVDRGVSDAAADVALDLEVAPCGVDERVAMNRCVPCTGGEGRRAGDDPRGPDTMCEPDACTEPFGISCTRFETAYLKGDTLTESAFFGTAVALDGDTLVVGAPGEGWGGRGVNAEQSGSAPNSGAVYVFRRTVEGWQQEAYIKADNADENDFFGFAIALDGDTLVVGAPYESGRFTFDPDNNEDPAAGAAYIYERRSSPDGPRWQQDAYLKSSLPVDGFFHGWDVDISGDTVVVGTPGSSRRAGRGSGDVAVFERVGADWVRGPELTADNGDIRDSFGLSVSLDGDTLVVGAPLEDGPGNLVPNSGAVYVFERADGDWIQRTYLRAANAEAEDEFGNTVALDGDTFVAGAFGEDSAGAPGDNSAFDSGAAYVFVRSGAAWRQDAYLKPAVVRRGDAFGAALAIDGSTIVIGARLEDGSSPGVNTPDDNGTVDVGAVYVFRRAGAMWPQQAYIHASNVGASDWFGRSLGLSGPMLVVGAPQEDSGAVGIGGADDDLRRDSGAAYLRRIAP